MLTLSMNFTSQYLNDNTKRFDNHVVVFISGWYKTEDGHPLTKTTAWIKSMTNY